MSPDNFNAVLTRLQERQPFKIFTIELNGGQRFEIDGPFAFVHREGIGVFVAPGGIPVWFDHESVNRIF
jgi:hypothetical protein